MLLLKLISSQLLKQNIIISACKLEEQIQQLEQINYTISQ